MEKDLIITELMSTKRPGMEKLIEKMENGGFFTAPCSTEFHLCIPGGLAQHSWNVYQTATKIAATILTDDEFLFYQNSLIICSMLHDLGKMGYCDMPGYIPNMIQDGKPTKAEPEQKYKRSDKKPYTRNPELRRTPHAIKSVEIIRQYIKLNNDECWAIEKHDGLYVRENYDLAGFETKLQMIISWADIWCCRFVEGEKGNIV